MEYTAGTMQNTFLSHHRGLEVRVWIDKLVYPSGFKLYVPPNFRIVEQDPSSKNRGPLYLL
jgi:hypothetical protein